MRLRFAGKDALVAVVVAPLAGDTFVVYVEKGRVEPDCQHIRVAVVQFPCDIKDRRAKHVLVAAQFEAVQVNRGVGVQAVKGQ